MCKATATRIHMYCGRSTTTPLTRIKYAFSRVLYPK